MRAFLLILLFAVQTASASVAWEDSLLHRWALTEKSGSTLVDGPGTADLTMYSGVMATLLNTDSLYADTPGLALSDMLEGRSSMWVGGIARVPSDIASYKRVLCGGDGSDSYFDLYCDTDSTLKFHLQMGAHSIVITGPSVLPDKVLEFAVVLDLRKVSATFITRAHTYNAAFSGSYTTTTGVWGGTWAGGTVSKLINVNGTGAFRVGAGGTLATPANYWGADIAFLAVGEGNPTAANLQNWLARPSKANTQRITRTTGRSALWLAVAGGGAKVQEVMGGDFANTLTFNAAPVWVTNLTGIPQVAVLGANPGFFIGNAAGYRLNAHAFTTTYTLADAINTNRAANETVEVVYQSATPFGSTTAEQMVFGATTRYSTSTRVGQYVIARGLTSSTVTGWRERGSGVNNTTSAADQSGTGALFHKGAKTVTMRNTGSANDTLRVWAGHHMKTDAIPAVGATATNMGEAVSGGLFQTTGTDKYPTPAAGDGLYYTMIGYKDVGDALTDLPPLYAMRVLDVRKYSFALPDSSVLDNREYDQDRNGGAIWHVDDRAPYDGTGSEEEPFTSLATAFAWANKGDEIRIHGTYDLTTTTNNACLAFNTVAAHYIGTYAGITIKGNGADASTIQRTRSYSYRVGDEDAALTEFPARYTAEGKGMPHLYDTTNMFTFLATVAVPFQDITWRDLTLDCNELASHAVVGTSTGAYGDGMRFYNVVAKNSHDWVGTYNETEERTEEHTAEPITTGWDNFQLYNCTGIANRSQMAYLATGAVERDISGFRVIGCEVRDSNRETFTHYAPSADSLLSATPWASLDSVYTGVVGSAICQVKLVDTYHCLSPVIMNNRQVDVGFSFLPFYQLDGGYIFNNLRVFLDANGNVQDDSGTGILMGVAAGNDCKDVVVAHNTFVGGLTGIDEYATGCTYIGNLFVGMGGADYQDESGTSDATFYDNVGTTGDLPSGDGNVPSGTVTVLSDYRLADTSDGYLGADDRSATYPALRWDIDSARRGSSWNPGAKR